jgi:hypothetical protein
MDELLIHVHDIKERLIRLEDKLDKTIENHSMCAVNSTRERSKVSTQIDLLWMFVIAIIPSIIVNFVIDFKK